MRAAAAVSVTLACLLYRPPGHVMAQWRLDATSPAVRRGLIVLGVTGLFAVAGVADWSGFEFGPRPLWGITLVGLATFGAHQLRRSRMHQEMRLRRGQVADLLGLMAAELRAGMLPAMVLADLADDFEFLRPAARAAELGGDVVAVLREAALRPGHETLSELAAGWQVAEQSGAPSAQVLARLESAVREQRDVDREVQAGVAPARATGRVMAVLPVVGLLLGSGIGGDPVAVLTESWVGFVSASCGCALACAGVEWIERIAMAAEQPR